MRILLTLLLSAAGFGAMAQSQVFTNFNLNPSSGSNPDNFTEVNGKLFFSAKSATQGNELWISDGTQAGTQLFMDINPGSGSSNPNRMIEMGGKLYFSIYNAALSHELWVSDGTSTGTILIKDIGNGSTLSLSNVVVTNGKFYFSATDALGTELWVSDGTPSGTQRIKDIAPGASNADPTNLHVYNGKVYFNARDVSHLNYELWVTDGTSAGTHMVKEINSASGQGSNPLGLTELNGKLYFFATDANGRELWVTDGTAANTVMVKDIYTGTGSGISPGSKYMILYNGKLYFHAGDGGAGNGLWVTDGTTVGTQMLSSAAGIPNDFKIYNGKLYFSAEDGTNGRELWVTDGTSTGTHIVTDLRPGFIGTTPTDLIVYKKFLYFKAAQKTGDYQLFITDGTSVGTKMVAPPTAVNWNPLPYARPLIMYDSTIYFAADYFGTGMELWSMKDTTGNSTNSIQLINAASFTISPNPASNNVIITTTENFTIGSVIITDISGKVVSTYNLHQPKQTIPLKGIAHGVYTISVMLDDKRSSQRLVIE